MKMKKGKKEYNSFKKTIIFLIIVVIFLGVAQLVLGGNIGACNKEMALVEGKTDEIEKENRLLKEDISFASSLKIIEEKAIALGFSTDLSLKDYRFEEPVALR